MPPMRTTPAPKPMKTERTHEENQERAYIAASRRSDRSLEARVESARRASEIHKRRTGRSLRVTEQDVINEEMYEEEDDDLPLQYRRLTAHLQTGSADFNRRLAAYLTNQVAMRSAMEQMAGNSYFQQYPNAAQFVQNQPAMYPSPMNIQSFGPSPTGSFRASPYPSPYQPGFRPNHNRAFSTAFPSAQSNSLANPSPSQNASLDHRRMSTPASLQPSLSLSIGTDDTKPEAEHQRQPQSATLPMNTYPPFWQDMGPFTMALPPATQQLLGPAFDMGDPFSANMMQGSENHLSSSYYPWSAMPMTSKYEQNVHPAYNGMSATLSPSALDPQGETLSANTAATTAAKSNDTMTAPSAGIDFNFSQESKTMNGFPPSAMMREDSAQSAGSGQRTPGEGFWDSFVQDEGWSDDVSAS